MTNLVKKYIKDDSCINLLAFTMTDDPANATASDMIRKVEAAPGHEIDAKDVSRGV